MSNDLILCLALDNERGRGAQALARLLHASARFHGFKEDFLVIHNRPEAFFDHYKPRARDFEKKLDHNWEGRHLSQSLKMHLDKLTDLTNRDRVMFCDIDTMFFDNPKMFFEHSEADISFARENISIARRQFNSCLSSEQMKTFHKEGIKGINSGQFVVRNGLASELFKTWRETLKTDWQRNNQIQDQGPFNKMLYSGKFTTEELPPNYVAFPFSNHKPNQHWDAKFIHYCGWKGATKMRLALQEFVGSAVIQGKDHAELVERFTREVL